MISPVQPLADGSMIEVVIVGREGVVGASVLLDAEPLSCDAIAQMAGSVFRIPVRHLRRADVTVARGRAKRTGLIANSRGRITIVDRLGLEAASCECCRSVRDENDRLLLCTSRRLVAPPIFGAARGGHIRP